MDNSTLVITMIAMILGGIILSAMLALLIVTLSKVQSMETIANERLYAILTQIQQLSAETDLQNFMTAGAESGNDAQPNALLAGGFPGLSPGGPTLYKTVDGRYSGNSIPNLLKQILDDPNSGLDEKQLDSLRNFFEKMVNESDTTDLDDDDEPPQEKWKKK